MIKEDIKRLMEKGYEFEGLNDCPGCESEKNFCFEHQNLQKELKKMGYDTIDINFNLEY